MSWLSSKGARESTAVALFLIPKAAIFSSPLFLALIRVRDSIARVGRRLSSQSVSQYEQRWRTQSELGSREGVGSERQQPATATVLLRRKKARIGCDTDADDV